MGKVSVDIREK